MERGNLKTVYMKVTMDEFELPVAVADSVAELAKMVGVKPNAIYHALSYQEKHGRKRCYKRIEITEDEQI